MREFKVNEYITLSMENNGIVIYITTTKHWAFRMVPFSKKDLSHEEEFREVCLNFKEWSEKGYDINILDPYIAFDLLRWLFKAGDQLAKKAFEVNLAYKLEIGSIPAREYLIKRNYFFTLEKDAFDLFFFDEDGHFKPFALDMLDTSETFKSQIKIIFRRDLHFADEERWAYVDLFLKSTDSYFLYDRVFNDMPLTTQEKNLCLELETIDKTLSSTLSNFEKSKLRKEKFKIAEKMRYGLMRYQPDPTRDRTYSELHPLLPVYFDDIDEFVYWGPSTLYDTLGEALDEKKIEGDEKLITFLEDYLKEDISYPQAKKLLEEKSIIDENFEEGARLYVKSFAGKFWDKLEAYSDESKERLMEALVKTVFDRYFQIVGGCPECTEIKEKMIWDIEDNCWYCAECYKKYKKVE